VNQETYQQERERRERERKAAAEKREAAQKELPSIQIDGDVWTATSKQDKRRTKTYTRNVRVGVTVYVRDWKAKDRLDQSFGQGYLPEDVYALSYFGFVRQAIRKAFDGAPWPCKVTHECDGSTSAHGDRYKAGWDYRISFYVSATYRAPKPSKIPSEDELLCWLVRYKQRLAALNAEYEAEREVQCAKLLAELGEGAGVTWEDAPDFEPDPRSTAAAKAKLPERVARLEAPSRRGRGLPSLSDERYDIKAADVE
jgi:hypothetical protein